MSAVSDYLRDRITDAYQRRWLGPTEGPLDGSEWSPSGIRDLPERHLLCAVTGLHDPGTDGSCRDCGTATGEAPVCAPGVMYPVSPDERRPS